MKRQIINDLETNNVDLDLTTYNRSTATYCCILSLIAYWKEKKIKEIVSGLNFEVSFKLYQHKSRTNDTQVLLWCTNKFLIISFRGTEPHMIIDWFTDAKFWKYQNTKSSNEKYGNMLPGHGGFRKSLMNLMSNNQIFIEIENLIKQHKPNEKPKKWPIILTGHSMGAGLAQLFMEPLNHKQYNLRGAYNFAPPLTISTKKKEYCLEKYNEITYDIINYRDYVPRAGRMGVSHFGKFFRIHKSGKIYRERERYIKFDLFERFFISKYHSIENHLEAVKNQQNSLEKILKRSKGSY